MIGPGSALVAHPGGDCRDQRPLVDQAVLTARDTVLMGRKTYEVAVRSGHGGGRYPGVKSYVFSRTLAEPFDESVTVVRQDAAEFVRDLKQEDGKDICLMEGGELARPLFEAGLIDEIGFNIDPALLGSGIPLFHPTFRPTVLVAEPNRELRWLGRLFMPGLFDGEHSFSIEPLGEGRVRFDQRERFRGVLVPLLSKMLDSDMRSGFEEMNRALKLRAESAP